MTVDATRWAQWARHYPVAPPALLYVLAFPAHAVGNFVWGPMEYVAIAFALVGSAGAALVCAMVLARTDSKERPRVWAGLIGAIVLAGFQITAIASPDSNSIGTGLLVFAGWIALGVGAFTERLAHRSH